MKTVVAVVLFVSVASAALAQVDVFYGEIDGEDVVVTESPSNAQRTPRWEYKVSERAGMNPTIVEKQLNDMAKNGWELSQIDQREGLYIFRRPVRSVSLSKVDEFDKMTIKRMQREVEMDLGQGPVLIPGEK